MDTHEEDLLKGESKPCWCCAKNLKTAALIVAIGIIYSHCIVLFILLTFLVVSLAEAEQYNTTFKDLTSFQIACVVGAIASFIYIPFGFLLLIGILKHRLWMCTIWLYTITIGSFVDFGLLAIDQTAYLVVFEIVFVMIRFYLLYVVWVYISVVKRHIKAQAEWEETTKSVRTSALSLENEKDGIPLPSAGAGGDSTVDIGLDLEDLSHDSVLDEINAADEKQSKDDEAQHKHENKAEHKV